jgi:hypothetical protein
VAIFNGKRVSRLQAGLALHSKSGSRSRWS